MAMSSGGVKLIATSVVFTFFSILCVVLRLWARGLTRSRLRTSDHLVIVGLLFAVALGVTSILLATIGGAGQNEDQLNLSQVQTILKLNLAAIYIWASAAFTIKMSIMFFFRELFHHYPKFIRAVWALSWIILAQFLSIVLSASLFCRPFNYVWDKTRPGKCGNIGVVYEAAAGSNLAIDFFIFVLPNFVLWKVQLPRRRKIQIAAVLSFGLLVCVVSSLRIYACLSMDESSFPYRLADEVTYAGLEIQLGLINACIPLFRPLFRRFQSRSSGLQPLASGTNKHDLNRSLQVPWEDLDPMCSFSSCPGRAFRAHNNAANLSVFQTQVEVGIKCPQEFDEVRKGGPDEICVHRSVDIFESVY